MQENLKDYLIKELKRYALLGDLFVVWAISSLILAFIIFNHIDIEILSCSFQSYEFVNESKDFRTNENDLATDFCGNERGIKILLAVFTFYIAVCIFSLVSRLQSTPVLYFRGIYLTDKDNQRPNIISALKFIFFSIDFIPLYIVFVYAYYHDFSPSYGQSTNIFILYLGLTTALHFGQILDSNKLVWDERTSDLRYKLKKKAEKDIEKKMANLKNPVSKFIKNIERMHLHSLIGFALITYLSFNVLKESPTPPEYFEIVYQREAPIWHDNAYFGLAGLNAPTEIRNSYEYGKEKVNFLSKRFADYKNLNDIPYTHNVPYEEYRLYNASALGEELYFDKKDIGNWDCLYNLNIKHTQKDCTPKETVLSLIELNQQLWDRFQKLTSYRSFSIPDIYLLESVYHQKDLLDLAFLNSVFILDLLERGATKEAISQWLLFMELYSNMVNTASSIVEKASFLILQTHHTLLLETLLYTDPQIAISYADKINDAISINDVRFYRAGHLLSDDWRSLEATDLGILVASPNQRHLLLECFRKMEKVSLLSASKYFDSEERESCFKEYPKDLNKLLLKGITDPGNPINNTLSNLLMPGILKGTDLIKQMHQNIVSFKMAMVTIELINKRVSSENIEEYLEAMPKQYWNPISESPFLWDQEKQSLYYLNPDRPELEPLKMFKVNLHK